MSNISKSAVQTILTQVPTQLFGIITGIFITRLLGPEGRGLYAIFYANIDLFITAFGFSVNTAIIYYIANNKIQKNKVFGLAILTCMTTVLLSVIILLFFWLTPFSKWIFPKELMRFEYFLILIIFILITQINTVFSALLQGAKEFSPVNRVLLLNSIYNIGCFGLVFLYHEITDELINLTEILLISLIVLLLNTYQWHIEYVKKFRYELNFLIKWKTEIFPFLKMTGIVHISNIINFFNYRLVLWVLAYFLDNQKIGIFSLGVGLSQLLSFISTPLSQVLIPFFSTENEEKRLEDFGRFARIHFSFILFFGLISLLLVPFLIPLLYGKDFSDAVMVYNIVLIGVILACQTKIIASFLFSSDKALLNLWATVIGFGLTFSFNFTLVKWYGINGGAFAQMITYTGIFLFVYFSMLVITRFRCYNIFIIKLEDLSYVRQQFKTKTTGN